MPELPDVETYRQFLDATARRKQIRRVRVADSQVVDDTSQRGLTNRLKNRRINQTRRHGKHLLVKFGADRWLAVHFGMTGDLAYYKDEDNAPDYAQAIFDLSNDYHLAYISQRKLGKIQPIDNPDEFIEQEDLGPDALAGLDGAEFVDLLAGRQGTIKSTLMNQSLIAGIGNVYSDEILYRARVHPATTVKSMENRDLKKLWRRLQSVLTKTIEKQAQPNQLPASWLVRRREEGASCGICDGTIIKRKFSGRGAYLCDTHQKRK